MCPDYITHAQPHHWHERETDMSRSQGVATRSPSSATRRRKGVVLARVPGRPSPSLDAEFDGSLFIFNMMWGVLPENERKNIKNMQFPQARSSVTEIARNLRVTSQYILGASVAKVAEDTMSSLRTIRPRPRGAGSSS